MLIGSARAEEVGALARIEAVAFGVDDVVDAVEKQAEGKNDVEKAEPKAGVTGIETAAEWHEVKEDGRRPKAGAGDLKEKRKIGEETIFFEGCGGAAKGRI